MEAGRVEFIFHVDPYRFGRRPRAVGQHVVALGLVALGVGYCVVSGWHPWSWIVLSSAVHGGVFVLRPPGQDDLWTLRTMAWSLLSTLSFAHFLMQDESFSGWGSVYHFCTGPGKERGLSGLAYCTNSYRWSLNGWRKALSIWNFVLSSALGLQRLFIELGLGGVLPGEEAIPRECFVSIVWRLVPFLFNSWESNFGAEVSSILFELPHFAVELLVVLPCVQLMASRLRVLTRPPRLEMPFGRWLVPDVMRNRWMTVRVLTGRTLTEDAVPPAQPRFWDRLRQNVRPLAFVCGLTFLAMVNAIVMPLFLENIAVKSAQSVEYMKYQAALGALQTGQVETWSHLHAYSMWGKLGGAAKRKGRAGGIRAEYVTEELIGIMSNTTLYECAASVFGPLADGSGCVSTGQRDMVTWMVERDVLVSLTDERGDGGGGGDHEHAIALNAKMLTAHPRWALEALEFAPGDDGDGEEEEEEEEEGKSAGETERLQHVLFGGFFYSSEVDTPLSFIAMQREFMEKTVRGAGEEGADVAEATNATNAAGGPIAAMRFLFGRPAPPTDASRFLLLAEKHTVELGQMVSAEHRSLIPLIEIALAIMRLSCEKWFSLVAVFVSYVVFGDPPVHAREYIKIVAIACRIFQHCILLSFPAVCWVYGAGFLFSTFASVVFWTNPIIRFVEHVKRVAMEVKPMHWHPVTRDEVERMGGNCAICWGTIITGEGRERDGDRDGDRDDTDVTMGLSCGHAYHQSCLLSWLQSCFAQSRKATCPMCQSMVPLKITYKLRAMLSFGADGGVGNGNGDGGEDRVQRPAVPEDALILEDEYAYPGLAALAQALREEFVGPWADHPVDLQRGGGAVGADDDNDEDEEDDPDYSEGEEEEDSVDALIISEDEESATSGSSIHWDGDGSDDDDDDDGSDEDDEDLPVGIRRTRMTLRPRRRY